MTKETIRLVKLSQLRESPSNPRKHFGDLSEMAASIKQQGIHQPIVVRETPDGLEIVFGHRRFRGAKLAGLTEIPVIVREMDDVQVLEAQLTENLARKDVSSLELAEGFRALMNKGFTSDQVGARLGVARSTLFHLLKLLDLTEMPRKELMAGNIETYAAIEIGKLKGERLQNDATKAVLAASKKGPLPVRAVRELIEKRFREPKKTAAKPVATAAENDAVSRRAVELLINRVGEVVGRRAQLEDADLRLMLVALGEDAKKLAPVKGAQLRVMLVTMVLRNWVQPGSDAEKATARAYGLQMSEITKTARALLEADGLFEE